MTGTTKPLRPSQAYYSGNESTLGLQPRVSVCIVYHNRERYVRRAKRQCGCRTLIPDIALPKKNPGVSSLLEQVIESIKQQTIGVNNIEIVVVENRSGAQLSPQLKHVENVVKDLGGRFISLPSSVSLSEARNIAIRNSRADYVIVMDDDNYAKPNEFEILLSVQRHTDADIVSCGDDYFSGPDSPSETTIPEGRWLPIGPSLALGKKPVQSRFLYCPLVCRTLVLLQPRKNLRHTAAINYDLSSLQIIVEWSSMNMFTAKCTPIAFFVGLPTLVQLRRSVLLDLEGFKEGAGSTGEDWELFAEAVFSGYSVEVSRRNRPGRVILIPKDLSNVFANRIECRTWLCRWFRSRFSGTGDSPIAWLKQRQSPCTWTE
eukprot:scaffold32_cov368-Prasinococcus_capsulatus_cf.AAC.5